MPNCDEYLDLISAAVDGALSPEEERRLTAHLVDCPHCREVLADFQALHAQLAGLPQASPPADLTDRILTAVAEDAAPAKKTAFHWKRWAACAAALVLALAGGWYFSFGGGVSSDSAGSQAAPAAAEAEMDGSAVERSLNEAVLADPEEYGQVVEPGPAEAGTDGEGAIPETAALDEFYFSATQDSPAADDKTAVTAGVPMEGARTAEIPAEAPVPAPTDAVNSGAYGDAPEDISGENAEPSNALPRLGSAQGTGKEKTAELTAAEALDRLLKEKGFAGWETRYDTGVSWPREGETQDHLVYDALSDNGKYYIFVSYRGVYDSADAEIPSHNSRNGCYAVPLDGGDILDETGPAFWERMAE